MTSQKQVVATYMDGFRESNHEKILACLTEDVTWHLAGYRTTPSSSPAG